MNHWGVLLIEGSIDISCNQLQSIAITITKVFTQDFYKPLTNYLIVLTAVQAVSTSF